VGTRVKGGSGKEPGLQSYIKASREIQNKTKAYRPKRITLRRTNTAFWKVKYKDKQDRLHYRRNQQQQRQTF